jgi:hypothetical protein
MQENKGMKIFAKKQSLKSLLLSFQKNQSATGREGKMFDLYNRKKVKRLKDRIDWLYRRVKRLENDVLDLADAVLGKVNPQLECRAIFLKRERGLERQIQELQRKVQSINDTKESQRRKLQSVIDKQNRNATRYNNTVEEFELIKNFIKSYIDKMDGRMEIKNPGLDKPRRIGIKDQPPCAVRGPSDKAVHRCGEGAE